MATWHMCSSDCHYPRLDAVSPAGHFPRGASSQAGCCFRGRETACEGLQSTRRSMRRRIDLAYVEKSSVAEPSGSRQMVSTGTSSIHWSSFHIRGCWLWTESDQPTVSALLRSPFQPRRSAQPLGLNQQLRRFSSDAAGSQHGTLCAWRPDK